MEPNILVKWGLQLGRADEEYIEALKRLDIECFPVRYSSGYYDAVLARHIIALVLFHEGDIIASVTAFAPGSAYWPRSVQDVRAGSAYLATLAVAPAWRRRGLARFLLRVMEAELAVLGCDYVSLHTKPSYAAAIQLYLQEGYRIVREMPEHYCIDNVNYDAVALEKSLHGNNTDKDNTDTSTDTSTTDTSSGSGRSTDTSTDSSSEEERHHQSICSTISQAVFGTPSRRRRRRSRSVSTRLV